MAIPVLSTTVDRMGPLVTSEWTGSLLPFSLSPPPPHTHKHSAKRSVTIQRSSGGYGFKMIGGNAVGLFISEVRAHVKDLLSGDHLSMFMCGNNVAHSTSHHHPHDYYILPHTHTHTPFGMCSNTTKHYSFLK